MGTVCFLGVLSESEPNDVSAHYGHMWVKSLMGYTHSSHCYIFGQPVLSTMAGGTARMRLPVPSLLQPGVTGTGGTRRSTTTSTVSSTTVHCTSVSATTVHHSRSTAQRGGSCKATSTASSSTSGSGGGGGSSSSGTSHANNSDRKVHGAPEESTGAASQTSMHSSRKMMALDSDPNTFYSAFLV